MRFKFFFGLSTKEARVLLASYLQNYMQLLGICAKPCPVGLSEGIPRQLSHECETVVTWERDRFHVDNFARIAEFLIAWAFTRNRLTRQISRG